MFYVVKAIYTFTNQDEAKDFFHDCQVALPKTTPIPSVEPYTDPCPLTYHACFHDEDPLQPCVLLGDSKGLVESPNPFREEV